MEHKKAHEPLLRMAKRGTALPGWKAWGIRLIGFLLSLVACALLIVSVVHISPLKVYGTIINAALGDKTSAWVTTRDAMTMLCIAVGLAPPFWIIHPVALPVSTAPTLDASELIVPAGAALLRSPRWEFFSFRMDRYCR